MVQAEIMGGLGLERCLKRVLFQSSDGHTIAENGPFRCPEGVRGGLEQHTALVGGTKRRRMDQVYGSSRKASSKERKHSSGEKSAVFPLSARIPREFMEIELRIGVSGISATP